MIRHAATLTACWTLREPVDLEQRIQKIQGSKKPIPGLARIYHDLQVAGDDAFELLMVAQKPMEFPSKACGSKITFRLKPRRRSSATCHLREADQGSSSKEG